MPVTLAQAQINTQADVDYAVIDNLRRYSWLLDQIDLDASGAQNEQTREREGAVVGGARVVRGVR